MKPSELLSGPEKWTKGAYGKRDGEICSVRELKTADCWCIKGAMYRTMKFEDTERHPLYRKVFRAVVELFPNRLYERPGNCSVAAFNDHPDTTFEDVKKVLKEAGL